MAKLEYKFGKYAIRNLTLVLIICYVIGYFLEYLGTYALNVSLTSYLTLNPYAIAHGQVWRLVSWLLIPPEESNIFFTIIMLVFYFSIGRTLERAWGDFQYNVYLIGGMLITILGSFVIFGIAYLFLYEQAGATVVVNGISYAVSDSGFVIKGSGTPMIVSAASYFDMISSYFSTYYINMSIFLAYAATFPEEKVLLMFIIPIKVKILGFIYAGFLVYEMITMILYLGNYGMGYVPPIVIGSSLLNFLLFFITTRNYIRMNHSQRKMHRAYERQQGSLSKEKMRRRRAESPDTGVLSVAGPKRTERI